MTSTILFLEMDSKKRRREKRACTSDEESQASPFELEVCKYLYRTMPLHEGRLAGCHINYFYATDAVTCLLQSKWSCSNSKEKHIKTVCFSNADVVLRFMEKLLEKKLIGRYSMASYTIFMLLYRAIKVKRKVASKRKEEEKRSKTRRNADVKKETASVSS